VTAQVPDLQPALDAGRLEIDPFVRGGMGLGYARQESGD
jgi:hypothetical protein